MQFWDRYWVALTVDLAQQPIRPRPILLQHSLTQQLTKQWPQFKALCQHFVGTRFEEHHQLHLSQKHKDTVLDSNVHVEINGLEEQADNYKTCDLYWKALSWLGTIKTLFPMRS